MSKFWKSAYSKLELVTSLAEIIFPNYNFKFNLNKNGKKYVITVQGLSLRALIYILHFNEIIKKTVCDQMLG